MLRTHSNENKIYASMYYVDKMMKWKKCASQLFNLKNNTELFQKSGSCNVLNIPCSCNIVNI